MRGVASRVLPIASRASTLALNVLLAVVVARLFGPGASGEFFLAFALVGVLGMTSRLGTEIQAIKELPHLHFSGATDAFWGHLQWLRRSCALGGVAGGTLTLIVGAAFAVSTPESLVGLHLAFLAASIPLTSRAILDSAALRSAGRTSRGAFAETGLTQGLTIIVLLTASAISTINPLTISAFYTAAAVVTAVTAAAWTRRTVPAAVLRAKRNPQRRNAELPAMMTMMGSSVLFFVLTASPLFILGIGASAAEVGFYNAAARSSVVVSLIPALQLSYLVPLVARSLSTGDTNEANSLLRRAVRQASAVAVMAAAAMAAFAPQIMDVFGGDFRAAQSTLLVLVLGQLLLVFLGVVNSLVTLVGLEKLSVGFAAIAMVSGVLPMLWASVTFGSVGAAIIFMVEALAYTCAGAYLLASRRGIRCYLR
jgi:O-antigen/teichoic acid export membrane protein